MENSLSFQCMRCGKCCNPSKSDPEMIHYIPIYLDETDQIESLAAQNNLKIRVDPDIMYYDELNSRLIILTYALQIDNDGCPFFQSQCSIYEQRPIVCKAYPLTICPSNETTAMILKPECLFVQKNNAALRNLEYYELSDVFSNEFPYSREIQIKGNEITNRIIQLENEQKIRVPVKLPVEPTEDMLALDKIRLDKIQ